MSWKKQFKNGVTIKITLFLRMFLGRKYTLDHAAPRILLICPTALGDNIWSSPCLKAIKQHYPQAYVAYLTSPTGHAILQHDPYIDQFFILPKDRLSHAIKLWWQLRKQLFQFVYILHASQRSILPLACLLGATKVIGVDKHVKGSMVLLDQAIANPPEQHTIISRLKGLQHIGIPMPKSPELKLHWTAQEQKATENFLAQHIKSISPFVVFQIGASKPTRIWPAKHFVRLGQWLQAQHYHIIITGGPQEADKVKHIARQIPQAIPLYGQLSLPAVAALINKAQLIVSSDTGPLHIGSANNVPLLALFGCCNPLKSGPFNDGIKHIVTLPDTQCQQLGDDRGVHLIPYDTVKKACENLLLQL